MIIIGNVHRQSGWWTANFLTYVKENIIIFSLFDEHTYDRDINYKYQSASPSGMISNLVSSTLTGGPILVPHLNLVKTRVNLI